MKKMKAMKSKMARGEEKVQMTSSEKPSAMKANKGSSRAKAVSDRYGNLPIR